jgi:hypothetical protein
MIKLFKVAFLAIAIFGTTSSILAHDGNHSGKITDVITDISCGGKDYEGDFDIIVMDTNGSSVSATTSNQNGQLTVNFESNSTGVYVIKMTNKATGEVTYKKIGIL